MPTATPDPAPYALLPMRSARRTGMILIDGLRTEGHEMGTGVRNWRPWVVAAGSLLFIGGGMHPEGGDGLSIRANFALMMADDAWVPGHSLMAVGAALLLVGVLLARRERAWPVPDTVMRFGVVAAAANVVELVIHTIVVVDKDALASGETQVLTALHLATAVAFYPLYGVAVAVLAFRLAGAWGRPLLAVSAVGVVGGVANALSAPLVILTEDSSYAVLFPVAGIAISVWLVAFGLAGARSPRPSPAVAVPA